MAKKLFNEIETGYDPKNRQVIICQDDKGFYVWKPRTGAKSKYFDTEDNEELRKAFNAEIGCSQNSGIDNSAAAPTSSEPTAEEIAAAKKAATAAKAKATREANKLAKQAQK